MKSYFNFLSPLSVVLLWSLFSQTTHARDLIVLENLGKDENAKLVLKILKEKFHIPETLVTYKKSSESCKVHPESIMHFCLKENAELEVLKVNRYIVENSLKSFDENP